MSAGERTAPWMDSPGQERLFLLGRVVALTFEEAQRELAGKLAESGYRLAGNANLRPSPVQPWPDKLWWDYMAEVEEVTSPYQGVKK